MYSTGPACKGWRAALGERFRDLPPAQVTGDPAQGLEFSGV
jgi:hypothetical protein